jgi:hypothetical protein
MVTFNHVPFLAQFCSELMKRFDGPVMTHTRGVYDVHVAGQARNATLDMELANVALEERYSFSNQSLELFVTWMSKVKGDIPSFLHEVLNSGHVQSLSDVDIA